MYAEGGRGRGGRVEVAVNTHLYCLPEYRSCLHGLVHHIAVLMPSTVANEVLTAVREAVCVPTDSGRIQEWCVRT